MGGKKDDITSGGDEEAASKRIEMPLDAFGDESNAEVQYKTMSWWQASMGKSIKLDKRTI